MKALRWLAILIAVLGVVDPVITTERFARTEIAVVAADASRDSALAARVARTLSSSFTVIPAPFADASATVVVGSRLPAQAAALGARVFAVSPEAAPSLEIERLDAPATAPLNGRVTVAALVQSRLARGRTVDMVLRDGDLVLDRQAMVIASDSARLSVNLSFTPTAVGVATLRVTAEARGAGEVDATTAVAVRDQRWSVLFYDPRPSWMSTFVRRAIERDSRFVATSRVMTSRNISTDAGAPPGGLADAASLALFDVVVVGAPESLTDADVTGLERLLRTTGRQVVLLLDQPSPGPYQRLLQGGRWRSDSGSSVLAIATPDSSDGVLRASEIAWPTRLPVGAQVIARTSSAKGDSGASRAIVWRTSVGAGQVIVSGALDAWRFRDRAMSGFDTFWPALLAEAAAAASPVVSVDVSPAAIAPEDSAVVTVSLPAVMLQEGTQPVHATVSAVLESPGSTSEVVRLWPAGEMGVLRGTVRARAPGLYRVVVTSGGQRVEAPLVVAGDARVARTAPAELLRAWVASHGGESITTAELPRLGGMLRRATGSEPRREPWHPMRSPWWIVPFALLLSAEWWFRRNRGLA